MWDRPLSYPIACISILAKLVTKFPSLYNLFKYGLLPTTNGKNMPSNAVISNEALRRLIGPIARKYNITAVSLFGSRARGDGREDSDYDFLIDVSDQYTFHDRIGFTDEMSGILHRSVDVVTRRSLLDDDFSKELLEQEVRIYG